MLKRKGRAGHDTHVAPCPLPPRPLSPLPGCSLRLWGPNICPPLSLPSQAKSGQGIQGLLEIGGENKRNCINITCFRKHFKNCSTIYNAATLPTPQPCELRLNTAKTTPGILWSSNTQLIAPSWNPLTLFLQLLTEYI